MDPCDISVTPPQMTRDSEHEDPQAFVLRASGLQESDGLGLPARAGAAPCAGQVPPARVLTESSAFPDEPSHLRGETEALCRAALCQSREGGRIGSLAEFRLVSRPRLLRHKWLVLRGAHQRDPADPPSGASGAESPQRLARGIPLRACASAGRAQPLQGPRFGVTRRGAPMRERAAVLPESAGRPSRVGGDSGGDSGGARGGKAGRAEGLASRGLRALGLHPAPGAQAGCAVGSPLQPARGAVRCWTPGGCSEL